MKYSIQSFVLGGLVFGFGLALAPTAMAAGDLPPADLQDQLKTQINQQATAELAEGLSGKSQTSPSPTPTPAPLIINAGDNTDVDNSSQQSSDTTVSNDNQANVNQEVNASANTGDNTANRNISIGGDAGVIHTGDASVYSQLETAANSNKTGVHNTCPAGQSSGGQIVNTGNNLGANGSSTNNCTTTITNGNGAVINQVTNGQANTGGNQANRNISIGGNAGVITTGNAHVGTMMVARANSNVVLVGGHSNNGGPGSGANIYIINTGNNATINDRRTSSNNTTVNNTNSALINQSASHSANTGDNTSNRNINRNGDAGIIRTGDAKVITSISAEANQNKTGVVNASNATSNNSTTELVNSGDNLDMDASDNSNTSTTVNNSNNAEVNQVVDAEANTGRNTASRNIAFNGNAGVIVTGDAVIATTLETDVNSNQTVVAGGNDGTDKSGTTTEIINSGDNVDVDTSSTTSNTTTVTNNNSADVSQTVEADANTGSNTANRNIGQTSISTGDVTITTEIITNANNNYTFIIDSNVTGLELFQQFVAAFWGMSWEDLMAGYNPSTTSTSNGDNTSVVNSGNNVTVLAENTQNRQVVVNNTNNAVVNQTVNASANTGNNSCKGNIGGCDIVTGDATIWTKLIANLNNNFTFIGEVALPEKPEQPEQPVQPEKEEQPEKVVRHPQVLGENVERPTAVLAATTLPMTGGSNLALIGGFLVIAGAALVARQRQANA